MISLKNGPTFSCGVTASFCSLSFGFHYCSIAAFPCGSAARPRCSINGPTRVLPAADVGCAVRTPGRTTTTSSRSPSTRCPAGSSRWAGCRLLLAVPPCYRSLWIRGLIAAFQHVFAVQRRGGCGLILELGLDDPNPNDPDGAQRRTATAQRTAAAAQKDLQSATSPAVLPCRLSSACSGSLRAHCVVAQGRR